MNVRKIGTWFGLAVGMWLMFSGFVIYGKLSYFLLGALISAGCGYILFKNILGQPHLTSFEDKIPAPPVSEKKENPDYYHDFSGTSIAVNRSDRTLTLKVGKLVGIYSFDQIRKWETNVQTGGTVYGGGIAGLAGTIAAGAENSRRTGLFLHIKDIDNPLWHIKFKIDRNINNNLAKWTEILNQTINES